MAGEELQNASEALRAASEAAGDDEARRRLYEHSDKLARFAAADHGPDHGQLARVERKARDAVEGADDDVVAHVEEAIEHVHAYREDLEGV